MKYNPAEHHEPLLEVPAQRSDSEAKQSKKSAPSVARGKCPECAAKATIGIVRQGGHLVWRLHHKATYSGARMDCGASGVALCVAQPVAIPGATTPECGCGQVAA